MEALVGSVVKVRANAIWNDREILKEMFDTPSQAFLHMVIVRVELGQGHKKPFIARLVRPDPDDTDFELRFAHTEVRRLLVEPADQYADTPFKDGAQDAW